ncbi:hypothetical protein GLYMA_06G117000v4 [Glycine max]|uniref:Uncharacterized protein n=1 Tax=Glycine max TaxID=3847 RepID=A0A0R0JFK0_SOYBN|nr:hypothetical protein GYH30_014818 [Glycine max]KAH1125410.1 hypothetical protein GYH30_014818 [Glycine max]KAH1125411.1 hypothetical protein GYH30_014818 [Glycine max]KAH1125412.1 hypothetical protein GYH30_014818 [Glycine max]KRH53293.1 hypothetical protein GLYMA_06G117000v4 [Glycine max]
MKSSGKECQGKCSNFVSVFLLENSMCLCVCVCIAFIPLVPKLHVLLNIGRKMHRNSSTSYF